MKHGDRFNKLVAIEPTDKRSKNYSVIWKFRCDCSNIIERNNYLVKSGVIKSCGCLRVENIKKAAAERIKNLKKEPNPVIFEGDIAILTTIGKYKIEFVIDAEDYEKIKNYRWFKGANNYIRSSLGKYNTYIYLHRLLCETNAEKIDFADNNIHNLRKSNLRPASYSMNYGNQLKRKTYAGRPTTSKYKGVSLRKDGSWQAQVTIYGKQQFKGIFKNEEEAAKAYNEAAKEIFGEYANLNVIK